MPVPFSRDWRLLPRRRLPIQCRADVVGGCPAEPDGEHTQKRLLPTTIVGGNGPILCPLNTRSGSEDDPDYR
jgi:hypothetical protein